jgi:porin
MTKALPCRRSMLTMASGAALAAALAVTARADPTADYSANLFGDLGGFREAFAKVGGTFNVTESSEVFANPYGGVARGADYDGLTTMTIQVDTRPGLRWEGGQFNASLLNIHGDNYSTRYIGALQTISGIQGDSATRLWELWFDQRIGDHFDLKVGQQSLDFEFAQHSSAGYFINAAFGLPIQWSLDMPAGGPAFPLSALGVRGKYNLGAVTVLGGVFSGSPVPASNDRDPQHANAYGLSFPVRGALAIAEAQYAINQGEGEYAGVYKVGGWWDSLSFNDLRYNGAGQPLADPAANPAHASHNGNFGFYAFGEQMIWRGPEKERTLSLFVRANVAPQSDRNLSTFSLDGGLALHEPFAGRKDDTFVLGFGWQHIGAAEAGLEAEAFNPGVYTPRRGDEIVFETNYQYQATAWMQIQPSLQYVHNPGGGGLLDPLNPTRRAGDALVGGLRVNITF